EIPHWIYSRIVRTGSVPSIRDISRERGETPAEIGQCLRRLGEIHAFALVPASGAIWMAAPFSAVPPRTGSALRAAGTGPTARGTRWLFRRCSGSTPRLRRDAPIVL